MEKLKTGIEAIGAERERQMSEEDYHADHDDKHVRCELVVAAVGYAGCVVIQSKRIPGMLEFVKEILPVNGFLKKKKADK